MPIRVRALGVITLLVSAMAFASCGDDETSGPNVPTEVFRATLSGAQERPNPVTSNGAGTAELTLFANDSIRYDIKAGQLDSITASHIHAGDPSVAGSIIFGFPNPAAPITLATVVPFQLGMIRRTSTFSGIFATGGFDSLVTRLRAGTAYVNIHTRRNPGGEIRGNLTKQ